MDDEIKSYLDSLICIPKDTEYMQAGIENEVSGLSLPLI